MIQYRFFSILCWFLNYTNQLTVIICYQYWYRFSVFIDWSSLDIAWDFLWKKHLQNSIFWYSSLKLLFKFMSTSSNYLIREFWDEYAIIIMDDFLVLPARSCWYVMTLGWHWQENSVEARFSLLSVLKSNLRNCYTICWWLLNNFKE